MDVVNDKIAYWKFQWENLIDNFLSKSYGLTLYSPHILIQDIITEIDENQFKNSENKKYFYSKIEEYLNDDEVIKDKMKSEFSLLRRHFNKGTSNYILSICKEIDETFKNGFYFIRNLELLEEILLNQIELNPETARKIDSYSQNLITELVQKSFVLKEIKKFVTNILDSYKWHGESVFSNFPIDFDYDALSKKGGKERNETVNNLIINTIDKLSLAERINKLTYYYFKKPQKVTYIFSIEGIIGDIEKKIFDVTFYNINQKRFLIDKNDVYTEDLNRQLSNGKEIQAAVEVEYLLPFTSLNTAKNKIENALDILSFYFRPKSKISLNESKFVIVDSNGEYLFSSSSREPNDPILTHNNSLNIEKHEKYINIINEFSFLWKNENNTKTINKIKNALHWYRKAERASKEADKILNYWIAIENLFDEQITEDVFNNSNMRKINLIQEIISSNQVFNFMYEIGWELHSHYESQVLTIGNGTQIPQNLVVKGQLNAKVGESI